MGRFKYFSLLICFAAADGVCNDQDAARCVLNSNCVLLDNHPTCFCQAGYSGSADAKNEREGECKPDKNEIIVSFHNVRTKIVWTSHGV